MSKVKIFALFMLCVLCATSAMAAIAIDETFEAGTLFADVGGEVVMTEETFEKGVNIRIPDNMKNDGYNNAADPIAYVDDPLAGRIEAISAGANCYRLHAGRSLQFGTIDGVNYVNGNIPNWGDSNNLVQVALAVNSTALDLPNGTVVGKLEITFDGLSIGNPSALRKQTYELRVDAANSEVDVWAIDNNGAAVKVYDGLNGMNWVNITTALFLRGLNTAADASQWGEIPVGGPQKGPARGTIMATSAAGDSARLSVFVNGNTPIDAARYGWTASNADGRIAIDGKNDGRIMGIKLTAGASNPLFIDNFFQASENWHNAERVAGHEQTNKHARLHPFTAPAQAVPQDEASATHWLIY